MAVKWNLADAIEKSRKSDRIGRSVQFTVCEGHQYVNGEPFDFTDTLLGTWTARRATRLLRREHGDDSITIVHATVYKQYVDMDLMDFWLNARATSDPVVVREHYIN